MGIQQGAENSRAGHEAREAVAHGSHARGPMAVDVALRHYLVAEQYAREHPHPDDRVDDDTEATGGRERGPDLTV